jgi:hypothetical protein
MPKKRKGKGKKPTQGNSLASVLEVQIDAASEVLRGLDRAGAEWVVLGLALRKVNSSPQLHEFIKKKLVKLHEFLCINSRYRGAGEGNGLGPRDHPMKSEGKIRPEWSKKVFLSKGHYMSMARVMHTGKPSWRNVLDIEMKPAPPWLWTAALFMPAGPHYAKNLTNNLTSWDGTALANPIANCYFFAVRLRQLFMGYRSARNALCHQSQDDDFDFDGFMTKLVKLLQYIGALDLAGEVERWRTECMDETKLYGVAYSATPGDLQALFTEVQYGIRELGTEVESVSRRQAWAKSMADAGFEKMREQFRNLEQRHGKRLKEHGKSIAQLQRNEQTVEGKLEELFEAQGSRNGSSSFPPPFPQHVIEEESAYVGNQNMLLSLQHAFFPSISDDKAETQGASAGNTGDDGERGLNCRVLSQAVSVALDGHGGIGKTATAKEFARRFRDNYPGGVFWVNADTEVTLQKGYHDMTVELELRLTDEQKADDVKLRKRLMKELVMLSEDITGGACDKDASGGESKKGHHRGTWLLILDNADDPQILCRPHCMPPKSANGHVLITSRANPAHSEFTELYGTLGVVPERALKMELLSMEDSVEMLWKLSLRSREGAGSSGSGGGGGGGGSGNSGAGAAASADIATHPNQENQEEEVDEALVVENAVEARAVEWLAGKEGLNGLALALEQAAAYVRENKCTFQQYRLLFEKLHTQLFEDENAGGQIGNSSSARRTVASTWRLNVQNLSPEAKELLRVCSFLSPDEMRDEFVERIAVEMKTGSLHCMFFPSSEDNAGASTSGGDVVDEQGSSAPSEQVKKCASGWSGVLKSRLVMRLGTQSSLWPMDMTAQQCSKTSKTLS